MQVTAKVISAFGLATQIVKFLYFLNHKFQAPSHICGCTARFVLDLIRNLEDRFSSDAAQFSVGGNWTDWTVWSSCSQTCGDGQMTRGRFCVNPRPANGGQDCVGAAEEQQTCNIGNCPGNDCVCFFVCVDVCLFCFFRFFMV